MAAMIPSDALMHRFFPGEMFKRWSRIRELSRWGNILLPGQPEISLMSEVYSDCRILNVPLFPLLKGERIKVVPK